VAEPKFKSERTALAGINSKASPFLVGNTEFLNLMNMDHQVPGALTQRWGSTQYIGQTFAGQINSLYEYEKLNGSSMIFTSHSGGIWFGATTGQYQGISYTNVGATIQTHGLFYTVAAAAGGAAFPPVQQYISWNYLSNEKTPIGFPTGSSSGFMEHASPLQNFQNNLDYITFENYLFMADGDKFAKFDGSTMTRVGLPYPQAEWVGASFLNPAGAAVGLIGVPTGDAFGASVTGSTAIGSFQFFISLVNDRGFESQIWPIAKFDANSASFYGASFIASTFDVRTPFGYGISAINVYSFYSQGTTTLWSPGYVFNSRYPASGSTVTTISLGTSTGGFSGLINNIGELPDPIVNTYFGLGTTFVRGASQNVVISEVSQTPFYPKFLEVYKNRVFAAGFSGALSNVKYSDLGEPEGYQLGNDFEVRTNDGDIISSLKAYSTRLYVFKRNSFQALYGDNPTNFYLQEISQTYGCLNNHCCIIYNDLLLFLDRTGIMQYDGSNLQSISEKINPIFDRMNYSAAVTNARMVHDKLRNEVLIAIPIDGSTVNNITITYDYMSQSWHYESGYTPSVFAAIKGYNNTKNAFYGTPSGVINWFGPSFLADNGTGYTCVIKTSWFHEMGETTEKQFRRLFLNINPTGTTFTLPVKFYQDYGASVVKSMTIVQSEFQTRTEYGLPAKSLAYEIFSNQTASIFQVTAISTEVRKQRGV
jgi:hypothetical protein